MKFSVLIPVYNTEKYLDECIQSVLNQTYQDFEIILVDDGSTDSSPQKCDEYHEKSPDRIKVVHQINSGQLVSRINAIKTAKGDYCVFLDSDDLLVNSALMIIHNAIIRYDTPDMITYPFYYDIDGQLDESRLMSSEEKLYNIQSVGELRKRFFEDILLNSMWTKGIKRTVLLESIGEYKKYAKLRCSEDRLQSMWVLDSITSAVYLPVPLYRYRIVDGSTTRTYTVDNIKNYNTSVLYSVEKSYLFKWGFDSKEWLNRFQAKQISYLLYVFDLFYLHVANKIQVFDYPWHEFIPQELHLNELENNPYISQNQKRLLNNILNKRVARIKWHYSKKLTYKKLRIIKRKVFG